MTNITTTQSEDRTVIAVSGRIDAVNASSFQDVLLPAINSAKRIELDCDGLTYISSAGLRVILLAAKTIKHTSASMTVRNLSPEVLKMIKITGLDAVLTIE